MKRRAKTPHKPVANASITRRASTSTTNAPRGNPATVTPSTTGVAHSIRDLARQVGRSHTAVQTWLRHADWNQALIPPWDVATARQWAASTLAPNQAETWSQPQAEPVNGLDALRRQPLQAAKLKLTLTRAAKLELERALLAGDLIDRREVEEGLVRRVHSARSALQLLPRQLAARVVGRDEIEVERVLAEGIDAALLELGQTPELSSPQGEEE